MVVNKSPKLKHKLSKGWHKYRIGIMFSAPFLILFFIFTVVPVFTAMGLSLTNYNMIQKPSFTGITNFRLLFTDDRVFLIALKNTFIFACITGPLGYIMSFMMAWVINQLHFRNMFSLAFYAPSITSAVAMSAVWLFFFSSDRYGLINDVLIRIGIINEPILWTKDPEYILWVVIIISVWMSMGTGFLVFLAGLQSIPKFLYEAAAIDGVKNRFMELWHITLPMMKPQLLFGAINSIVGAFGVFDIAVSVAGIPSPNYAAHTIVTHLYDYAFIRFQMGYASAVAVFLFLLTFYLGRISMKIFSSE
ncbi:MAG TPA: sugar ABC transporter permease [Clostridiaceae bacterium]|nr:sugar ABC transporter permease [Clostridiaceae bacterium]